MATAGISSTFDIAVTGSGGLNAAGDLNVAKTFTATRAFTIVGVSCNNIAAGAGTLNIQNAGSPLTGTTAAPPVAGDAIVQTQANGFGATQTITIVGGAACEVASGATVRILASATTVTRVILHCVASGGGEAITVS
ncbi:hypothetical protein K0U83_03240 [bacterium]|nr:hypothetical protein [bacterium]